MKIYDFIGIGFGPANIALAIQLEENNLSNKLSYKFIDSAKDSFWLGEMMIDGSDIQNIPFRDLITPINPQSHYTFINYLHKNGKYFKYFNTGLKYPLRKDYAMYINWCASHFIDYINYKESVVQINASECGKHYIIKTTSDVYHAKMLLIGTGRSLYIPKIFDNIPNHKLITINNYISRISTLDKNQKYKFAIIGASQSAAEIFLDLANKFPDATINSYIRKFSFAMKDLSPLSYEIYFPEFIEEYYHADDEAKALLNDHLRRTNYSSVDPDILEQINLKIYEENLDNKHRLGIKRNTDIIQATFSNDSVVLSTKNNINGEQCIDSYDFIIVCTGFKDLGEEENKEFLPPLLSNFKDNVTTLDNKNGAVRYISPNYEVFVKNTELPIYLNGLCETSHGMGDAGSFSLISIRVNKILKSILKNLEHQRA